MCNVSVLAHGHLPFVGLAGQLNTKRLHLKKILHPLGFILSHSNNGHQACVQFVYLMLCILYFTVVNAMAL